MQAIGQHPQILNRLRREIRSLEGYGREHELPRIETGLGCIESAFPEGRLPGAAVHEFISPGSEQAAATSGFLSGLLQAFLKNGNHCLWISDGLHIYPPALRAFGLSPERIIFIDLRNDREALWAIEEALRCEALSVVVGELRELDFTQSRRLQLAVESSGVTAFIHRKSPRAENTTACLTRWKISPLPSETEAGLPGVGFPRWNVHLQKVRNGRPGSWQLEWTPQGFRHVPAMRAGVRKQFMTQSA